MFAKAEVRRVQKVWMSQKEAMAYLGVSRDWLKDRRNSGRLSFSVDDGTTFYVKSELDRIVVDGAVVGRARFQAARRRSLEEGNGGP